MSFQAIQAMENQSPVTSPEATSQEEEFYVKLIDDPQYGELTEHEKRLLAAEAVLD